MFDKWFEPNGIRDDMIEGLNLFINMKEITGLHITKIKTTCYTKSTINDIDYILDV